MHCVPTTQPFPSAMLRLTQKHLFSLSILLMALIAAYPLMSEPGLLNTRGGGDSPFLLQRLHQLETAVLDGHFPVRWMPDANYGYGYPFYNYYAPLSIYIAAFFRVLGFSFVRAIQLSQLLGFIVAGWGMFALGKRWFKSEWAGLLVAGAYTVAPFHLVNVYVRGDSLAEFWAMAFYPIVILTAENLLQSQNRRRDTAVFALSYAALILSHNISAMIFSPFLLAFIGIRALGIGDWGRCPELVEGLGIRDWRLGIRDWGSKNKEQQSTASNQQLIVTQSSNKAQNKSPNYPITQLPSRASLFALSLFGILLAFALSAWFFIPALADQGLAQLDTVTEGYFNYNTHFLATEDLPLIQDSFFFDYSVRGRVAYRTGLVQGITAVIAIILLFATPKKPQNRLFIVGTILLATFMMIPWSKLLWDQLPLLSFTQFPWRFLSIQAFGFALAMGSLATLPKARWVTVGTLLLLYASSFGQLRTDHLILTDADVTAVKLAQYEWFTGNIGTTISAEYLPQTVQPRPYTSPWLNSGFQGQFVDLNGGVESGFNRLGSTTRQTWFFEVNQSSIIVLPTLNWPGWTVTLNGETVPHQSAPGSGLIMLSLPEGSQTVKLRLRRTPTQRWAEIVSLLALVGTIFLYRSGTKTDITPSKKPITATTHNHDSQLPNPQSFEKLRTGSPIPTAPITQLPNYQLLIPLLALLTLILHLWPNNALPASNLTWDFTNMGYLHHDVNGVFYDGGAILKEYYYNSESVEAGDTLVIELVWDGMVPETAVSLVSPAINRPEFDPSAPPLATAMAEDLGDGRQKVTFELPENSPAGLVLPRLTVTDQRAQTPSGGSRGLIHLRPFLINNTSPTPVTKPDVQVSEIKLIEPDLMQVGLAWQLPAPITQNNNVSLRLTDANGNFLRLIDRQPGYGYLPSSGWEPNQTVHDWHLVPLPPLAENHATPYILVAQLYDVTNSEPTLFRRLGEITPSENNLIFEPTQALTELPAGLEEATAVYDNKIALRGYSLTQTDEQLQLTLAWQALTESPVDYIRFVHLLDPQGPPEPLVQSDSFPQNNTYPTTQWRPGDIIIESITLPISNLTNDDYQLAVGFYHFVDGAIVGLTAVDENGEGLENGRFLFTLTNK
ncbi:MAG: 6-pyruvoyl-tetrahydropterin synthase-related protein [Chloroflexota bacterium]